MVLRSAILLALLSLEIAIVISEEKNVPFAQDGTINSIGSLNRYSSKIGKSDKLSGGIYYRPNDQVAAIETLQSNVKLENKRYSDGIVDTGFRRGSESGDYVKIYTNFGSGRWLRGWRDGGIGMNLGSDDELNSWRLGNLGVGLGGSGGPRSGGYDGIGIVFGRGEWPGSRGFVGIDIDSENSKRPESGEAGRINLDLISAKFPDSKKHGASSMSWGAVDAGTHESSGYGVGFAVVGNKMMVKSDEPMKVHIPV